VSHSVQIDRWLCIIFCRYWFVLQNAVLTSVMWNTQHQT